jgi:hypothetical protein
MSQLSKRSRVAEALAYGRQWLEERKDLDLFGTGVPTLHPEAGEMWLRQHLKLMAMSSKLEMMWVIENARGGWDEADAALRELASELMNGKQCPVMLESYAIEVLPTPHRRSRGRRKSRNALQDILLAGLMIELVKNFDLPPTRKTEAHQDSVCDILVIVVNKAKWMRRQFDYWSAERLWGRLGSPNAI